MLKERHAASYPILHYGTTRTNILFAPAEPYGLLSQKLRDCVQVDVRSRSTVILSVHLTSCLLHLQW